MMRKEELSFFGYGKTTRAIARLFGGGFDFYDDNSAESFTDTEGNRIHPSREFDPQKSSMQILTPGIRPESPLLKRALNPVSEYDLFLDSSYRELFELFAPGYPVDKSPLTIWVSGTNGKTTTTQMLTHLLEERGAVSGGNIGTPLAQLDPRSPIWVLETSSYTLHHSKKASPGIYLLLPVTPDHLSWHGSAEAYERDKISVVERMREGELALVPRGMKVPKSAAWVVEYADIADIASYFDIELSRLKYRGAFAMDASLALAVCRTLFDECDYEAINSFQIDAHRQQELGDSMGRVWVNDSKATNIDAAIQAIYAYCDTPLHLILGGDDKGVDLSPLMDILSTMQVRLYAVASNRKKLESMAKERKIPVSVHERIPEALEEIASVAVEGETILLSPAAASLDQYPSYVARGEEFIRFVKSLS